MNSHNAHGSEISKEISFSPLSDQFQSISNKCINCDLCQNECKFLRNYGKPKEIADAFDPDNRIHQSMAFECSLCHLCAAVCPVGIDPADMFLEMRRDTVKRGKGTFSGHNGILAYEYRGISKRFTWYGLPQGCDTVFFPGCTLPGIRPETTRAIFELMQQKIPSLGIVLDCCTKPSHDLGRQDFFESMLNEMKDYLIQNGIQKVLVACPNCQRIFDRYGEGLSVGSIYEFLADQPSLVDRHMDGVVTVHDPCALRDNKNVQSSVRRIIEKLGLVNSEMPHSGKKTLCCGEGGAAGALSPDLAQQWASIRKQETDGNRVITYCAGCVTFLNQTMPTGHILDLFFKPKDTLSDTVKVHKPPLTYWNRLRLKNHLKSHLNAVVTRERTFQGDGGDTRYGKWKRVIILLAIISTIVAVRTSGAMQYLEQERLHDLVQAHGSMTPLIYMLIYAITPALFLPGLPITIVGGILFGPFQGVVYTIFGSTMGACVAFLISRYIARDWVDAKIKSPQWRHLDQGVERHGWKVVAFTRLIPLFPFNLLNYAFGLTNIKFSHYAVMTFICMLPACIAFIVFSNSLLDLFKGRISGSFVAGMGMIVLVSLMPFFYKRYKIKKGISDPL